MKRTHFLGLGLLLGLSTTPKLWADETDSAAALNPVEEIHSIQLPIFEKGKFAGYRDMPLEPDRIPNAEPIVESQSTENSENESQPASIKSEWNETTGEQ